MADNPETEKPLLTQILDQMLVGLEGKEEFDAELIEKIRELTATDDLNKPAEIIKLIKPGSSS